MKDIAFHITDIAENSLRAGANEVGIALLLDGALLTLTITDNGCGMNTETIARVTNPFYTTRTTRKVGLGVPFLFQNAEQSGGRATITSEVGVGTHVQASFDTAHIDCPPLGDIAETAMHLLTANPAVNTTLTFTSEAGEFSISTAELIEAVSPIPLGHPEVATMVREMVNEAVSEILSLPL